MRISRNKLAMNSWRGVLLATLLSVFCADLGAADLNAEQALEEMREQHVVLVDVRTPAEWKQTGVPSGAARISVTQHPQGERGFVADVLALVDGDRNRPIAVICRTGRRSARAERLLERNGFTHVYNVVEGMAGSSAGPGWLARGLPTEACTTC